MRCPSTIIAPTSSRILARAALSALLVALTAAAGCTPSAADSLLLVACQAVRRCAAADDHLEAKLLEKNEQEKQALDAALLADLKGLASADGKLNYKDVVQAKALYDKQVTEIIESRRNIRSLFRNKRRTYEAILDLIAKARGLSPRDGHVAQEALNTIIMAGQPTSHTPPKASQ